MEQINVTSKQDIKNLVTSKFDGDYNFFSGCVRNGRKYAHIGYFFVNHKCCIEIIYIEDGQSTAVAAASHCYTASGVINKVSKFLNVK